MRKPLYNLSGCSYNANTTGASDQWSYLFIPAEFSANVPKLFKNIGEVFLIVVLLILLLCAVITDVSKTRIPNPIIIAGLITGIFYRVLCLGDRGYPGIVLGIFLPVIVFFPLFMMRAMGAGDIKLFAVTGAFFTIPQNMKCIVIAIGLGGVIALIKILFYKNIRERFRYLFSYLGNVFRHISAGQAYLPPYMDEHNSENVKVSGIKFSLPVLLSAICVIGGGA